MNINRTATGQKQISRPARKACANPAAGSDGSVLHIFVKDQGFTCAYVRRTCKPDGLAIANNAHSESRPDRRIRSVGWTLGTYLSRHPVRRHAAQHCEHEGFRCGGQHLQEPSAARNSDLVRWTSNLLLRESSSSRFSNNFDQVDHIADSFPLVWFKVNFRPFDLHC